MSNRESIARRADAALQTRGLPFSTFRKPADTLAGQGLGINFIGVLVNQALHTCRCWLLSAFCVAGIAGCNSSAPPANAKPAITALVAASTAEAVEEIARQFTEKTGQRVVISPGATNALAQQILSGAPADVFLSAAQNWGDEIEKAGLAAEQRSLLRNTLVLVVPKGNPAEVHAPADLMKDAVERIALAGENVPAGKYADQALKSLDLTEKLAAAGKIVRGTDVRATLNHIERGEVEAGIVYATDAQASSLVEVIHTFENSLHDDIVYPVVLLRRADQSTFGREFYEYLFSPDAAVVFRKAGFLPLTSAAHHQPAAQARALRHSHLLTPQGVGLHSGFSQGS